MSDFQRELQLGDYVALFRRRIWWVVLVALGVFAAVAVFTFTRDEVYRSRAEVLIRNEENEALFQRAGALDWELRRESIAELQFVSGRDFKGPANQAAGFTADVVAEIKTVSPSEDLPGVSGVLQFTSYDADPQRAADAVNAYADTYVRLRHDQDVEEYATRERANEALLAELEEEAAVYEAAFADIDGRIEAATDATELALLLSERRRVESEFQPALAAVNAEKTEVAGTLDDIRVVRRVLEDPNAAARVLNVGFVPQAPIEPDVPRNLLLGAAAALVLGVCAALVRDALDNRVGEGAEVASRLGVPVLAEIPVLPGRKKAPGGVTPFHELDSQVAESYRSLRTSLQFLHVDDPMRTIMVTSDVSESGKTQTVVNLGTAISATGSRVLLIDADLHKPALAARLGMELSAGLSDAIAGTAAIDDVLRDTPLERLTLLDAGTSPPNPSELLASERFGQLVALLAARYDLVLIDTPPALAVSDPRLVAARVDGVIVVYHARRSRLTDVRRTLELLSTTRDNIVGVVANRVRSSPFPYYRSGEPGAPPPPEASPLPVEGSADEATADAAVGPGRLNGAGAADHGHGDDLPSEATRS